MKDEVTRIMEWFKPGRANETQYQQAKDQLRKLLQLRPWRSTHG